MKRNRIRPDLTREKSLWQSGLNYIGGIDEAGRGSWAGPVFAAVVVLSPKKTNIELLENICDSKQMTANQRMAWAPKIKEQCFDWGVGNSTNEEIDRLGIVPATRLAARRALQQLKVSPEFILLDYLILDEILTPQRAIIRGDQQVLSIAAASIIAKTSRDEFMRKVDPLYPPYLFRKNKGYGTVAHREALLKHGICPIHRLSYKPVMAINNAPQTVFD